MARIKAVVSAPEEIEVSLTITMKVSEWRRLHGQLTRDYPSWNIGSAITNMLAAFHSSREEALENLD